MIKMGVGSRGVVLAYAGAAVAVGLGWSVASAEPGSLEGAWSGSGTVTFASGSSEAARCRASFRRQSADRFAMNAVCATPSGRVAQTAEVDRISATRFAGEFSNSEYGVTGNINITVRGNNLSASLSGGGASASFSLSK